MLRRTVLLTVIFFLFFFSSCEKVCPGFQDAYYERWFPYRNNQQLTFTSSANRQAIVWVDSAYTSDEGDFQATKSTLRCESKAFFSLTGFLDLAQGNPDMGILASRRNAKTYISLQAPLRYTDKAGDVYNAVLEEDGLEISNQPLVSSQTHASLVLNGKTFSNVQEIFIDTVYNYGRRSVYKFWLAPDKGLVGYETYPSREQWVLE